MIRCRFRYPASLLGAAVLAGCATPDLDPVGPFGPQHREALLERARPPATYGLTVYAGDRGPVFAGAARLHAGHADTLPFVSDRNTTSPQIPVTRGGIDNLAFLLDTSAPRSWIRQTARTELGGVILAAPGPIELLPIHVEDAVTGWATVLPKLQLGDVHVENAVAFTRNTFGPLDALARWEGGDDVQGVLGYDLLRVFSFVTIDCRGRTLALSADQPFRPAPGAVLVEVPVLPEAGVLMCRGRINGVPTDIVLDLAGDFEVVMANPPEDRLRQVSVGNLVFRDVEVLRGDELGLGADTPARIGRQLLERFVVTLDNANRRVVFSRP